MPFSDMTAGAGEQNMLLMAQLREKRGKFLDNPGHFLRWTFWDRTDIFVFPFFSKKML